MILQYCRDELSFIKDKKYWAALASEVCNDKDATFNNPVFILYVEKLLSDGLIKNNNGDYIVTIDGLFHEGFVNKSNRIIIENNRIRNLENSNNEFRDRSENISNQMVRATNILAFGTVALVLVELMNHFSEHPLRLYCYYFL